MKRAHILAWGALAAAALALSTGLFRIKETAMAETGPSTDLSQLRKFIALPAEPETVRFELLPAPAKGEGHLCAALTFSAAEAERIIGAAPPERPGGGMLTITVPASLDPAANGVATDGNGLQSTGLPIYPPDPFARSPYLQGFFISPGPGRILLCLAAN